MNAAAVLDVYTLHDLFELNDVTEEEALEFLVTRGFLTLPEVQPLDF